MKNGLVVHESAGIQAVDICGTATELINAELSGSGALSLAKISVKAGATSRRHYHKKMVEIYFIVGGSGRMILGEATSEVGPGHAIFIPAGLWHQIVNEGPEDLVFLCADSPAFDDTDVFER